MHEDILDRLRLDPGPRTIGRLLQDREAARHEILRLRACIEQESPRTPTQFLMDDGIFRRCIERRSSHTLRFRPWIDRTGR